MSTAHPSTIVKRVRLTEKASTLQAKNNSYVLEVVPTANKIQIRQAVEKLFNVKVTRVNTISVHGKIRRQFTKQRGWTSSKKKAIVTLKEGDKIDLGV